MFQRRWETPSGPPVDSFMLSAPWARERVSVLTRKWEAVHQPLFGTRWCRVSQVFGRAAVEARFSPSRALT